MDRPALIRWFGGLFLVLLALPAAAVDYEYRKFWANGYDTGWSGSYQAAATAGCAKAMEWDTSKDGLPRRVTACSAAGSAPTILVTGRGEVSWGGSWHDLGNYTFNLEWRVVVPNPCQPRANQAVEPDAPGGYTCARAEGHVYCMAHTSTQPTGDFQNVCLPMDNGSGDACVADGIRSMYARRDDGSWSSWINDPKFTGEQCTPPSSPPPAPLPEGKCSGTVNGATVIVDCGTTTVPKTTSTTNTVSSTSGTVTTSVTTNGSTTCTGEKCVTSTTTTTTTTTVTPSSPPGSTPTTTTTTQSGTKLEEKAKSEYCKENPNEKQCNGDNSQFSGSCTAKFTCSGGAAECAIARAVNEANCQLTPSAEIGAVASQLAAGTFGPTMTNTVRNVGSFDQSNPLSGACPSDHTLTAGGMSVVIPLASACAELQMMGNVLVAFTLLAATLFVLKGLS